jgi:hypothetical protein
MVEGSALLAATEMELASSAACSLDATGLLFGRAQDWTVSNAATANSKHA